MIDNTPKTELTINSWEDIESWLTDPVTKEFMEYVRELHYNNNCDVHRCLKNPHTLQEAALYNAALDALSEVLNGPQTMIEDRKGASNATGTINASKAHAGKTK